MKVIIRYPKEYKTPMSIETIKDIEDAVDRAAEVKQGFGQALVISDKELAELGELIKKEKP